MENTFSKVGHRNYAIVNIETLTAEEKAAVESARKREGFYGVVPYTHIKNGKLDVYYYQVFQTMGYTIVLDDESDKIRFIHKGFITEDEISFMNKGNSCAFIRNWYLRLNAQLQQNENPWNLE